MRIEIRDQVITGHRPGKDKNTENNNSASFLKKTKNIIFKYLPVKLQTHAAQDWSAGGVFSSEPGSRGPVLGRSLSIASSESETSTVPSLPMSISERRNSSLFSIPFNSAQACEDARPNVHDIKKLAKSWGTADIASVTEVVRALCGTGDGEGEIHLEQVPTDPSRIYFLRNTERKFCDMKTASISNNPYAMARVLERSSDKRVPVLPNGQIDLSIPLTEVKVSRGGGINCLVSTNPFHFNRYGDQEAAANSAISIMFTLQDVLNHGKILKDAGAIVNNAVLVKMDEGKRVNFAVKF